MKAQDLEFESKKITLHGLAHWCKFSTPDPKYPKDNVDAHWTGKIRIPTEEAENIIEAIFKPMIEGGRQVVLEGGVFKPTKAKPDMKECDDPWEIEYDDDGEEETGYVLIGFKNGASGTSKKTGKKWSWKLPVYDSQLKFIKDVPEVWNDSEVKVSLILTCFYNPAIGLGLKRELTGVQIIELKSGNSESPSDMGFEVEEGYTNEPVANDNNYNNSENEFGDNGSEEDEDFKEA